MKTEIAKGAAWVGATRVAVNLLSALSSVILARLLVPEDFGVVAAATTVSSIALSITELSLSSALIRLEKPAPHHFDTAWTLGILRATLLGIIIALFSPVAAYLFHDDRVINVLLVLSISTLIGGLANPKLVVFQRNLVFWQEFFFQVGMKAVALVAAFSVAFAYRSYWALIAGSVASQITYVALGYLFFPYRPSWSLAGTRDLLGFSVWLTLSQAVNTLNLKADPIAIGYFLGPNQLGTYSYGDNLAALPTREMAAPLSQVLFPAFSQIASEPARLQDAYIRAQRLISGFTLPLGFGFAVVADSLIAVVLGDKWLEAAFVVSVLAPVVALQMLTNPLHAAAMAQGHTRALFRRDLALVVMRLPLLTLGAVLGGIRGILFARILTGVIGLSVNLKLVEKLLDISLWRQLQANVRALLATSVVVGFLVGIQASGTLELFVSRDTIAYPVILIFCGCVLYPTNVFVLWRAAGRPDGFERDVLAWTAPVVARFNGTRR
jgi:PST family polysaccharide transporter